MGVKVADKFVAMGDFELLNAQDVLVDIKGTSKRLQEAIDNGELGGGSDSEETIDGEAVKKFEIDNCGVKGTESVLLVDGEFTTVAGEEQEYPYYKITKSSGELKQNTRLNKATMYEVVVDDVTYKFVGKECFNIDDGFAKGEFVGNSTMVDSTFYTAETTNEDLDWVLIADTVAAAYLYIVTKEPRKIKLKVSQCTRTVVPFFNDLIFGTLFDPFFIKADGSAYSNVSIAGANKIDTAHRGVIAIGDCNVVGEKSEFDITFGYGNSAKTSNYNAIVGTNNKIEEGKVNNYTGSQHIFGGENTSKGYNNYIVGAQSSVHAGWSTVLGTFCIIDGGVICSSAIGYDTECHANLSTAIGPRAKVSEGAECSTAIGKYVIAAHKGQVALGFGNKGSEKNLLEIGNGKDSEGNYIYEYGFPKEEDITRDNAFEVTYDGVATAKTGIGVDDVTLTKEELTTLKNVPAEIEEVKNTMVTTTTGAKVESMTQAEYDALETKDSKTLYNIIDKSSVINDFNEASGDNTFSASFIKNNFLTSQATFTVSSNEDLTKWATNANGNDYTYVYIAPGTYTLESGSINLTETGTKIVEGHPNAKLVFKSTNVAINTNYYPALYYTTRPDSQEYKMTNVIIDVTSMNATSSNVYATGFYNCVNMLNCYATSKSTGTKDWQAAYGYYSCSCLINCQGAASGANNGNAYTFASCSYLTNCIADETVYPATYDSKADIIPYASCSYLTNCQAKATNGYELTRGYFGCNYLTGCSATVSSSTATSTEISGFSRCSRMVNCYASITNTTGKTLTNVGGFINSTMLDNCVSSDQIYNSSYVFKCNASAYTSSYADNYSTACDDTPIGGYNHIGTLGWNGNKWQ